MSMYNIFKTFFKYLRDFQAQTNIVCANKIYLLLKILKKISKI